MWASSMDNCPYGSYRMLPCSPNDSGAFYQHIIDIPAVSEELRNDVVGFVSSMFRSNFPYSRVLLYEKLILILRCDHEYDSDDVDLFHMNCLSVRGVSKDLSGKYLVRKAAIVGLALVRNSYLFRLPTLECVCVLPTFKRLGFGEELVRAAQSKYSHLMLHVDISNHHYQAVNLYNKCGFKKVREDVREIEMEWHEQ